MDNREKHVIIVGGGLAGLSMAIRAAEAGVHVDLFSIVPVRRSHSVCAQGGINAARDPHGEGDTTWTHFDDTIYGGDFLANQPPVKDMCEAGPGIIDLMDRMGVMFNRTPEGVVDVRAFGGSKYKRTAFAGATTGQQLLYALDEQVRRHEADGKITKYENWEFLAPVIDGEKHCRGIVAMDLKSMEVRAFESGATALCTGGPGLIFGRHSTNSAISTGSAGAAAYRAGALYANGEFIQVHPTAIPGEDKLRLISESVRGEGGRVWTYRDGKPWYFLEEWYPAWGNLVPRDVATRAIFRVVFEMGLGVDGRNLVYLDMTHIPAHELEVKLEGIIDIYQTFLNEDPRKVPMKIFPAVHYSMGGLWVDFDHQTNIKGLFAAGEADYQYHGANRLGANSLLSCIYSGLKTGPIIAKYLKGLHGLSPAAALLNEEQKRQEEINAGLMARKDGENPYRLYEEMGDTMAESVTVIRDNAKLEQTDKKLQELRERYPRVSLPDKSKWGNQGLAFTRQLDNMLNLARVITLGALARNESRGAHYKPAFPERDDKNWLKTTLASHTENGPKLDYEPVDVSFIPPRTRSYKAEK